MHPCLEGPSLVCSLPCPCPAPASTLASASIEHCCTIHSPSPHPSPPMYLLMPSLPPPSALLQSSPRLLQLPSHNNNAVPRKQLRPHIPPFPRESLHHRSTTSKLPLPYHSITLLPVSLYI
ncbi:hypothetical protein P280DRAFT_96351 [Massarina eburnea CBS 473.64]|uniref:Uncharacterized protein n=1 Tax=Massarina eburnea CBS 473.64 TaxID=1395130 RepID=A0A6A6RUU5_9PLEO|nr:hypothetical protein P280DRAFT_96351 [Massarina eburnea CBS 473.64]